MSEDCALVVWNIISLYRLHLADLWELILSWVAIAESDSADVFFPATHVPFLTATPLEPLNGILLVFLYPRSTQTTFLEVIQPLPKESASAFYDESAQVRS